MLSQRPRPDEFPIFLKMYICLTAVREGFISRCRRIIGVDGCFLKRLLKGQLLVVVWRDWNNQLFSITWAVVAKEII